MEDNERKPKRDRPGKRNKTGPSEEALQLSTKLKEYSRNKNIDAALKEYWDSSNDSIRDGHHACIMVDCSARSGKISVGNQQLRVAEHLLSVRHDTHFQSSHCVFSHCILFSGWRGNH